MEIKAKRAFIISDTHLGARSNSVEWLEVMRDWFYSDFLPRVEKEYRPGDILIHCGDVFDNRQSVNLLVLHEGMVKYWYCGNIPPRPLDEKEGKDFEMRGKDDRTKFGPIRGFFLEENWQFKKKSSKDRQKCSMRRSHNQRKGIERP